MIKLIFSPVILLGIIWGFIEGAFFAGKVLAYIYMEKNNEAPSDS